MTRLSQYKVCHHQGEGIRPGNCDPHLCVGHRSLVFEQSAVNPWGCLAVKCHVDLLSQHRLPVTSQTPCTGCLEASMSESAFWTLDRITDMEILFCVLDSVGL
jgi:hypothetical protein